MIGHVETIFTSLLVTYCTHNGTMLETTKLKGPFLCHHVFPLIVSAHAACEIIVFVAK